MRSRFANKCMPTYHVQKPSLCFIPLWPPKAKNPFLGHLHYGNSTQPLKNWQTTSAQKGFLKYCMWTGEISSYSTQPLKTYKQHYVYRSEMLKNFSRTRLSFSICKCMYITKILEATTTYKVSFPRLKLRRGDFQCLPLIHMPCWKTALSLVHTIHHFVLSPCAIPMPPPFVRQKKKIVISALHHHGGPNTLVYLQIMLQVDTNYGASCQLIELHLLNYMHAPVNIWEMGKP